MDGESSKSYICTTPVTQVASDIYFAITLANFGAAFIDFAIDC